MAVLGEGAKRDSDEKIDNTKEVAETLKAQKKRRILIPSTEKDRDPVSVQVNGYCYVIKRDEEVEVPEAVVEVLKNAKLTTYVQRKRENGDGNELVPVVSTRFAFQIL